MTEATVERVSLVNSQTLCADMFGVGLVGWLNVFNVELSPERSWRGPRSQEVGGEGDYTYTALSPPPE